MKIIVAFSVSENAKNALELSIKHAKVINGVVTIFDLYFRSGIP